MWDCRGACGLRRAQSSRAAGARIVVGSDWAPLWGYEDIVLGDPEAVYGDLLGELRRPSTVGSGRRPEPAEGRRGDLRIVNLECSLSDGDAAPIAKGGPNLRGDPRTASGWAKELVREWFSLTTEEAAGLAAR